MLVAIARVGDVAKEGTVPVRQPVDIGHSGTLNRIRSAAPQDARVRGVGVLEPPQEAGLSLARTDGVDVELGEGLGRVGGGVRAARDEARTRECRAQARQHRCHALQSTGHEAQSHHVRSALLSRGVDRRVRGVVLNRQQLDPVSGVLEPGGEGRDRAVELHPGLGGMDEEDIHVSQRVG